MITPAPYDLTGIMYVIEKEDEYRIYCTLCDRNIDLTDKEYKAIITNYGGKLLYLHGLDAEIHFETSEAVVWFLLSIGVDNIRVRTLTRE